jgi:hypothetical protein
MAAARLLPRCPTLPCFPQLCVLGAKSPSVGSSVECFLCLFWVFTVIFLGNCLGAVTVITKPIPCVDSAVSEHLLLVYDFFFCAQAASPCKARILTVVCRVPARRSVPVVRGSQIKSLRNYTSLFSLGNCAWGEVARG